MSKLVDKARLQKLAQALDARMKDAVKGVQDQLDALVGDGEGSVVEQINAAKQELQGAIGDVAQNLADFEGEQATKEAAQDKALEDAVKEIEDAMADEADRVNDKIADDIATESAERVAEEARIEGKVDKFIEQTYAADKAAQLEKDNDQDKALEDAVDAIEGAMATEAQRVNDKIAADIKTATDAQALVNADFEGRIAANEAFVAAQPAIDAEQDRRLGELEAKFDGDDSVDAKIAAAQAAAEKHADDADAALKAELQQEIDDDVQVVADELAKQMDATQDGTLAKQIADEKARMDAFMDANAIKEGTIDTLKEIQLYIEEHGAEAAGMVEDIAANKKAVEDEAKRAAEEEARIEEKFDEIIGEHSVAADENGEGGSEGFGLRKEIENAESNAKTYTDAKVQEANGRVEELAQATGQAIMDLTTAIENETTRAGREEAAIRQEMADAIGQHAAEGVVASGLRKEMDDAVAAEKERAMAEEADIRADFADADAALHATVKAEMAAVIQSLAVGIVEVEEDGKTVNKLRVALGGIEGDDVLVIREQEVPFVTDAEIDAIIDGLDAVQGE